MPDRNIVRRLLPSNSKCWGWDSRKKSNSHIPGSVPSQMVGRNRENIKFSILYMHFERDLSPRVARWVRTMHPSNIHEDLGFGRVWFIAPGGREARREVFQRDITNTLSWENGYGNCSGGNPS